MFETIIVSVAFVLSLPISMLVWKVSHHVSTIRQMSHQAFLNLQEAEAKSLLLRQEEENRALSGVKALERTEKLEQDKIKAVRSREEADAKATAKAAKDEEQRAAKEAKDAEKAAEQARVAKIRRDAFVKDGHQLWRMHTLIKNHDKNGYRVPAYTVYDWECFCAQRAGSWFKSEVSATNDFIQHQEIRKNYVGSEHGVDL
jgi:hypothetical protein